MFSRSILESSRCRQLAAGSRDKRRKFNPMRNKLFIFTLGGALAFGVSALAQDNAAQPQTQSPDQTQGQPGQGPMRMDPNRQLEHMTRELGLSADQQNQIRPLLVDRQQKMEALFQDQSIA